MVRLRAGADIVLTSVAVEAIVSAVEDGGTAGIRGRRMDDGDGAYYVLGGSDGDLIGLAASEAEGGTEPGDDLVRSFTEGFGDGVLAVVDPYADEFALYVSEGGVLRRATAVMSE